MSSRCDKPLADSEDLSITPDASLVLGGMWPLHGGFQPFLNLLFVSWGICGELRVHLAASWALESEAVGQSQCLPSGALAATLQVNQLQAVPSWHLTVIHCHCIYWNLPKH